MSISGSFVGGVNQQAHRLPTTAKLIAPVRSARSGRSHERFTAPAGPASGQVIAAGPAFQTCRDRVLPRLQVVAVAVGELPEVGRTGVAECRELVDDLGLAAAVGRVERNRDPAGPLAGNDLGVGDPLSPYTLGDEPGAWLAMGVDLEDRAWLAVIGRGRGKPRVPARRPIPLAASLIPPRSTCGHRRQ